MVFNPDILATIAGKAEDADWSGAVSGALDKPTTDSLTALSSFPNKMAPVHDALAGYDDWQRTRNLRAALDVAGLLNDGNTNAALDRLRTRRKDLEGRESTEITDALMADISSGDPARISRARGIAGLVIAATLGDDAPGMLEKIGFGKARKPVASRPGGWSIDEAGGSSVTWNPIDFAQFTPRLDTAPLMQGLQLRRQRQALDLDQRRFAADQAKTQSAEARKARFLFAFNQVSGKPTQAGWRALRGEFPDFMDEVGKGERAFSESGNAVMSQTTGDIIAGIDAGNPELAVGAIDRTLPALEGSGIPADSLQTIRGLVATGKPEQMKTARGLAALLLARHSGDRFDQVYRTLTSEDRERELQPLRLRKDSADADYAETRAQFAPRQEAATLAGKSARIANTQSVIAKREEAPVSRPRSSAATPPKKRRAASGKVYVNPQTGERRQWNGSTWERL